MFLQNLWLSPHDFWRKVIIRAIKVAIINGY